MTQTTEQKDIEYASFTLRMLASVIDTLLSSIVLVPIFEMFNNIFKWSDMSELAQGNVQVVSMEEAIAMLMQSMPSFLFQSFIFAAVIIIFWIYKAATPGKMLLKMKIVDVNTGNHPTKKQSVVRYLGYFLSFLPLCLGFIWIYFDKKKQGFHDKIAGTVVIKTGPLFSFKTGDK